MKVKMIKDFNVHDQWIRKDEVLKVRLFCEIPLSIFPKVQIIEGVHSGVFIPREVFIEVKDEVTYTEKQWNDMENHYMKKLDALEHEMTQLKNEIGKNSDHEKAILPLEVYEAFTRFEGGWKKHLDTESIRLLLLTLLGIRTLEGDALVLKKYAMVNSTMYMKAILNGYTISNEDMGKSQIRKWYQGAQIREADGIDPDGFAKEAIEEVVYYLGGTHILADLSPFCSNQLKRKEVN